METINYTNTLEDCRDFIKYQTKIKRFKKYAFKVLAAFWALGSMILFIIFHNNFNIEYILHFSIICVSVFCVVVLSYKFDSFHYYSKKIYKSFKNIDNIELQAQEDCLYVKSNRESGSLNWEAIVDIYDSGKLFLIFVNEVAAVLVPKRAFENEEKALEFFNFVNEKLKNK